MKTSVEIFTKYILLVGCASLSACGGGSDSANKSPEIKANATTPYHVELNAVKSLIVNGKKIKFERYNVCESEHKVGCYPAVLVFQGDDKLVYQHLTSDQSDLKVSLVTMEQYAMAKENSSVTEDSFKILLSEIQQPLKKLNPMYLGRCRFTKEWQAMTELTAKDRKVLYVQFSPSELRPDILFRFDTESGSVGTFKTQIRNASAKQEDPFLILSARDEVGDLAQDNALISFNKHSEKCRGIYQRLQPAIATYSETVDKDASNIMDYFYDNEERTSPESNVPFLGASVTKALMPPYLETIYPEDQTY